MKVLKALAAFIIAVAAVFAICSAVAYNTNRDNVELIARINKSGVRWADAVLACGEDTKLEGEVIDADATERTVVLETKNVELGNNTDVIYVVRDEPHVIRRTIAGYEYSPVFIVEVPTGAVPKTLTDKGEERLARLDTIRRAINGTNVTAMDIALEALFRGAFPAAIIVVAVFLWWLI